MTTCNVALVLLLAAGPAVAQIGQPDMDTWSLVAELANPATEVRCSEIRLQDLSGDGLADLAWVERQTLHVADQKGQILWTAPLGPGDEQRISMIQDIDGDAVAEVGIFSREGRDCSITFWQAPAPGQTAGILLREFRAEGGLSNGLPDSTLIPGG